MSVSDEIRRKQEEFERVKVEREERERQEQIYAQALREGGMERSSAVLIQPPAEIKKIIDETKPYMTFNGKKVVKRMPDGVYMVRQVREGDSRYYTSFDVTLEFVEGKNGYSINLWILEEGHISFSKNGNKISYQDVCKYTKLDARGIREKIINTIALKNMNESSSNVNKYVKRSDSYGQSSSPTQQSSSGECCYIATAVYGSYDCPEVWVLRRFRDDFLKKYSLGKGFIKAYYTFSPSLVRLFGKQKWFNVFFRGSLDKLVRVLMKKGFSDERYSDHKEEQ